MTIAFCVAGIIAIMVAISEESYSSLFVAFLCIISVIGITAFSWKSSSEALEDRWETSDPVPVISVANSTKIEGEARSFLGSGYGSIEEGNVYKYFTRAEDGSIELKETSAEDIKIFDDANDEEAWLEEKTCTRQRKEPREEKRNPIAKMSEELFSPASFREGNPCGTELRIHIPADGIISGSYLDPRR
ncbi:hypothetical protein [Corynebacterium mastitidis]|uniref:hypothetical protein n=1 Tax=Corynebacterium mastitidis TaxID=161890 RepID=UPI0012EA035C|nr:hypothetical protein [Corynebacterium mastitidis]